MCVFTATAPDVLPGRLAVSQLVRQVAGTWQAVAEDLLPLGACPTREVTKPPPPRAAGTGGSFRHPGPSGDPTKLLLPPKLRFTLDPLRSGAVKPVAAPRAHGAHTNSHSPQQRQPAPWP